jgi:hypothetical protein
MIGKREEGGVSIEMERYAQSVGREGFELLEMDKTDDMTIPDQLDPPNLLHNLSSNNSPNHRTPQSKTNNRQKDDMPIPMCEKSESEECYFKKEERKVHCWFRSRGVSLLMIIQ